MRPARRNRGMAQETRDRERVQSKQMPEWHVDAWLYADGMSFLTLLCECESESVHYADADGGGETGWNICISNTPSWMLQHQRGVARLGEARRRDGSDGMFETYGIRTEKAAVGPIQCTNSTLKVSSWSIRFQRIAAFFSSDCPKWSCWSYRLGTLLAGQRR